VCSCVLYDPITVEVGSICHLANSKNRVYLVHFMSFLLINIVTFVYLCSTVYVYCL
jgi:hypothetical protein